MFREFGGGFRAVLGLYWDNGEGHGNYHIIGIISGLCEGSGFRVLGLKGNFRRLTLNRKP